MGLLVTYYIEWVYLLHLLLNGFTCYTLYWMGLLVTPYIEGVYLLHLILNGLTWYTLY